MKDRIFHVCDRYYSEIQAEGAWCGHMYAQEYLADIYNEVRDILTELGKSDPNYEIRSQQYEMRIDYNNLTDKIYKCQDMTSEERYRLADILQRDFHNTLENGIKLLEQVYQKLTGKEMDNEIFGCC